MKQKHLNNDPNDDILMTMLIKYITMKVHSINVNVTWLRKPPFIFPSQPILFTYFFLKQKRGSSRSNFFWKIVKRAQKIRKERIICLRLCVRGNFIFLAKHKARSRQSVCPSVVLKQTSTKTPLKGVVDIFFLTWQDPRMFWGKMHLVTAPAMTQGKGRK